MSKKITIHVPASSANLGPGFDVLGVALNLFNSVTFVVEGKNPMTASRPPVSVSIDIHGEGLGLLPRDKSNLVVRAAYRVFEKLKKWPIALRVSQMNRIPLARGMGSSAAATIAGLCAANRLLGTPLSEQVLLDMAVDLEGHADNVVPALVGGFCVSGIVNRQTHYLKFNAPANLHAVLCIPEKLLPTSTARRILPSRVPLTSAVFTSSRTAFLLGSIVQKRYDWLGFAMEDVLHQPARAALIPGLAAVIHEARNAGAWGAALSGAGSSIVAFSKAGGAAKRVGQAMQRCFAQHGEPSRFVDLTLNNQGIRWR